MDDLYKHKSFFKTQEIRITQNGVDVKLKSFFDYYEYKVDFDQFTTKKIIKKEANSALLFFIFSFSLVTIMSFISTLINVEKGFGWAIILLIITLLIVLVTILTKKRIVILTTQYGHNELEIKFTRLNEKEIREFADKIIQKTKDYLIMKYAKVDKDLPREGQLENIISLKGRNIISDLEFEKLKNIVLDKEKKVGF